VHLAAALLFHLVSAALVHAPGRCVPQVIAFLEKHIPPEQYDVLLQC
jgi:hypothetical protein